MTTHRECRKCGERKSLDEFSPHAAGKYGKQSRCKACCNEKNKAAYLANLEANREKSRLRALRDQAENPEARNASRKRWLAANPEKNIASKRKYADANRELVRASSRRWYEANKHRWREYSEAYCKRLRAAGPRWTKADVDRMCEAQGGGCVYCGRRLSSGMDVDHKTPLTRGGSNNADNLQLLCKTCNRKKFQRTHEEYLAFIG